MKNILNNLGIIIVTLLLLAIPMLTACAFLLNWDGFFKFVYIILSIIDFCIIAISLDIVGKAKSTKADFS